MMGQWLLLGWLTELGFCCSSFQHARNTAAAKYGMVMWDIHSKL